MDMKLIVKSPTQKYSDQSFDINTSWTVKELKSYLSEEYPSKPAVKGQRLIYSGRLLEDNQNLAQVFQSGGDSTVIIHLVCSHEMNTEAKANKVSATENNNTSPNSTSLHGNLVNNLPHPTSQSHENATELATPSLAPGAMLSQLYPGGIPPLINPYLSPYLVNPYMPLIASYLPTNLSGGTPSSLESAMAMQQLYSRHLTNYSSVASLSSASVMPHLYNYSLVNGQPLISPAPGPNQGPQPNRPVINENMRNNDVDDDDDDEDNGDWLEIVNYIPRVLVLASLIYFHSSLTRLALIFALALCLYLYRAGILFTGPVAEVNRPVVVDVPPAMPQDQRAAPPVDGLRARRSPASPAPSQDTSRPATTESEGRCNLRVVWIVLSSLFTSLIPEQYPVDLH